MHNSPIDLLVRAPGQHKAAPSEPEPDGRFSELMRRPADAAPETPAEDAKAGSTKATAAPAADKPVAEEPSPAVPGDGPRSAVSPAEGDGPVQPLAIVPDAMTNTDVSLAEQIVAPDGGAAVEEAVVATVGLPKPIAAPGTQQADPARPGATNTASDRAATPTAGDQAGIQKPLGTVADGRPATPPPANAPASDPVRPTAGPGPIAAMPVDAGGPTPVSSGDAPPGAAANPAFAAGAAEAREGAATVASIPPTATATKPVSALGKQGSAAVNPAPDAVPTADAELLADAAELPAPRPDSPTVRTANGPPAADRKTAGAAAVPTGEKPPAAMPQPAARPETRIAEPPPATAQIETVGPTAGQAARPAVEAATPVQVGTGNTPPPAAEQVVLQVRRAVAAGVDRLTVQLKPATLGRVDVQMEVGFDGRVQAVVSAERPETLYLLQRDARALTTALTDAGLQADSGSLSFNLRGQTGDQAGGNDRLAPDGIGTPAAEDDGDDPIAPITLTLGAGRVDIKV